VGDIPRSFETLFWEVDPETVADADAEPMPRELTPERWTAIKRDFESWVLSLT
jgi:hypothetical protein